MTIKGEYEFKSKRDVKAMRVCNEIMSELEKFGVYGSGDFTSRINRLGTIIIDEIKSAKTKGLPLSPERITNIVFRGGIQQMRQLIDKHTSQQNQLILLFDNIDKGWLAQGVDEFDVRLVRLMIESLDKIRRDFEAEHRRFMSVVFLRNDIYELLIGQTPDRGKAGQIRIDWTDRAKLRQVIFLRIESSSGIENSSFGELWSRYFIENVENQDSFEYFVDNCLMRPRFLINIIENAVANAINRGHEKVQEVDCVDAVRQHSLYLISDFGYEIRDVSGLPSDILYALVGASRILTKGEVMERFEKYGVGETDLEKAFKMMLWYGVLGIAVRTGAEHFIYDYDYDMRRLEAEMRLGGDELLFVVNSGLHVAMKV